MKIAPHLLIIAFAFCSFNNVQAQQLHARAAYWPLNIGIARIYNYQIGAEYIFKSKRSLLLNYSNIRAYSYLSGTIERGNTYSIGSNIYLNKKKTNPFFIGTLLFYQKEVTRQYEEILPGIEYSYFTDNNIGLALYSGKKIRLFKRFCIEPAIGGKIIYKRPSYEALGYDGIKKNEKTYKDKIVFGLYYNLIFTYRFGKN